MVLGDDRNHIEVLKLGFVARHHIVYCYELTEALVVFVKHLRDLLKTIHSRSYITSAATGNVT
jgi:hypothetical protein